MGRNKQRGERKRKRMEWGKTRCGEWPYSFAGRDSYWLYRQSLSPLFLLRLGTAARENFENYKNNSNFQGQKNIYPWKDRILCSSQQGSWESVDRGTSGNIEYAIDANYALLLLLFFFSFSIRKRCIHARELIIKGN